MTSSLETSGRASASSVWPSSVRERAVAMVRGGATRTAAARRFRVGLSTIGAWCRAEGLMASRGPKGPRSTSQALRAEILRRIRAGESRAQVADELGTSSSVVSKACLQAGLGPAERHGPRSWRPKGQRSPSPAERVEDRLEAYLGARALVGLGPATLRICADAAATVGRRRSPEGIRYALKRLESQGRVQRIRHGRGRAHLWTITPG